MPKKRPLPVWAQSLGCPKNRVDTERVLGSLGVPIRLTSHIGRARLLFINTCAFIEPASRESIRAILDVSEKIGSLRKKPFLVVAGCLPGRYGTLELKKEFPEVDLWLTPENQAQWPTLLARSLLPVENVEKNRLLSTGPAYAWLKIAEGCDHRCAFCAIPAIKGPAVSEPLENILEEAAMLLAQGVRELDVVAQDVLAWGKDFPNHGGRPQGLEMLLENLAQLTGLVWLRLFYLYPAAITPAFLENMAKIGSPLLPYLDIPFQHCQKSILAAMGRPFQKDPRETISLIRSILPDVALRGTLIVGYPGESEKDFRELCDFVEETRFHNLGVFTFYPEDGTRAASLPFQIPHEVAERRRDELMALQAGISREILAGYVGSRQNVLVDASRAEEWPGLHAGRVWFQAPEVDGITYVSGEGVKPGALVEAEIVDSQTYDLSAIT